MNIVELKSTIFLSEMLACYVKNLPAMSAVHHTQKKSQFKALVTTFMLIPQNDEQIFRHSVVKYLEIYCRTHTHTHTHTHAHTLMQLSVRNLTEEGRRKRRKKKKERVIYVNVLGTLKWRD